MLFPAILIGIDDLVVNHLIGRRSIPPRMSPAAIVIALPQVVAAVAGAASASSQQQHRAAKIDMALLVDLD